MRAVIAGNAALTAGNCVGPVNQIEKHIHHEQYSRILVSVMLLFTNVITLDDTLRAAHDVMDVQPARILGFHMCIFKKFKVVFVNDSS